jgi:hypothetical protein
MTLKQTGIVVGLVLSNLIIFWIGYSLLNVKVEPPPDTPAPPQIVYLEITASPTATSQPIFTATPLAIATPTWTLVPLPVAAPTIASPTPTRPPATRVRPTATRAPAASSQPPVAQTGTDSTNPLLPGSDWKILPSGASVWFKLGQGGDHIEALLESKISFGMSMDIFAPGNLDRPIGVGRSLPDTNGLTWSGGQGNSNGVWLARITNSNIMAVQYRLTTTISAIRTPEAVSFQERGGADPL